MATEFEKKQLTRQIEAYEGMTSAQRVASGPVTKELLEIHDADPWQDASPVNTVYTGAAGALLIAAVGGWDSMRGLNDRFRDARTKAMLETGTAADGMRVDTTGFQSPLLAGTQTFIDEAGDAVSSPTQWVQATGKFLGNVAESGGSVLRNLGEGVAEGAGLKTGPLVAAGLGLLVVWIGVSVAARTLVRETVG